MNDLSVSTVIDKEQLTWDLFTLVCQLSPKQRAMLEYLTAEMNDEGVVSPEGELPVYKVAAKQLCRSVSYCHEGIDELLWAGLIKAVKGRGQGKMGYQVLGHKLYDHWSLSTFLEHGVIKGKPQYVRGLWWRGILGKVKKGIS